MEKRMEIDRLTREIQALCEDMPMMRRLQILNRCRRIRLRSKGLPDVEPPVIERKAYQKEMILEYLQMGHSLTPLEALRHFGCFRLSARIADIRKAGHEVHAEIITDESTGKKYANYTLIKQ